MFDHNYFNGKTVLVTGGTRGIGREIVHLFSKLGANVAFTFVNSRDTAKNIEMTFKNTAGIKADNLLADSAQYAVKETLNRFGSLDILVLNAGITKDRVSWKLEPADFDTVLSANLKAAFLFAQAVTPIFRNQKYGKIITISSINGIRGKGGQVAYSASKGGLIAFTKVLAKELGVKNINVNSVAPGFIETDMTRSLPKEIKQRAIDESALKRVGKPEDIAGAVLFLASDFAKHITGQVICVDGGQLI